MAYLINNSNLFSIQSAISEFTRVILSQNQVISSLQTAIGALETITASNTVTIAGQASSIASNTSAIAGQASSIASNTSAIAGQASSIASNTSAIAGQASSIASNTSAIAGQASSITSNTTNITTVLDQLAATNRTVAANTTFLSTIATNVGNLQPVVAGHTSLLATLQSNITTVTADLSVKTNEISVLDSISAGHTTSIGVNYNEIFRLNGTSLNHTNLLAGLRTDLDAVGSVSDSDIVALQSAVSTINSTLTAHDVRISYNLDVFIGFLGSSQSLIVRLNSVEADLSTINTTLTAHGGRLDSIEAVASGVASTISTIQSNATFHANALGVLTTRVNQQVDTILVLTNAVDTLGDQITSSGDIDALTSTVDGLATQVSTISTRSFTNMQQIGALQTIVSGHTTQINANTTLADALLNASQFNSGLISVIDGKIITLRDNVDANTLSNTQLLTVLQNQATTIFAIDGAIQISNGKIEMLEASQITQDDLIREFDQEFNDPATGVIFKINSLTTTYNAHISGVYLTLRRNVDDNNLILGTLSTQTTSLLTAMTQIFTRVEDLETGTSAPPSNFDLYDRYNSTNYVRGGVLQTSSNISIEQALEIGLTISNLHAIVHNVTGTTFFCGPGGDLVPGQASTRTTFIKK